MADHITLQFVGLRELGMAIEKWGADLEADSRKALEEEVAGTVTAMKATSAFRDKTGNLRKSIGGRVEPVGVSARIRARAPHAHLIEWGHGGPHKAGPRPFFVPEVIKARKRLYDAIERLLAKKRDV